MTKFFNYYNPNCHWQRGTSEATSSLSIVRHVLFAKHGYEVAFPNKSGQAVPRNDKAC